MQASRTAHIQQRDLGAIKHNVALIHACCSVTSVQNVFASQHVI